MKKLLLFPFAGIAGLVVVLVLLLASNLYTYHRLSAEAPIAELSFTRTGPQRFIADVAWGDFCTGHRFELRGDQWRLDAQFLKWRPWANLLGLDAMYRIERLQGRYRLEQDENAQPASAHALHEADGIDLPALLDRYDGILSPVDTLYGSSVYDAMDEQHIYRVYRGQSGLLVRHERKLPAGRVLSIDIRRDCDAEDS